MSRAIQLTLQVGLLFSAIAAIVFAVRIIIGLTLGANWFWGGAVGAFLGPVSFAIALYLYERRVATESKHA